MPKTNETINDNLYNILKSKGFTVTMLASNGSQVPVAEEADVFQFDFADSKHNHGTVTASIDGLRNLVIYYNSEVLKSESGTDHNWATFVKEMKKFAQKNQLGFDLTNLDRLNQDMKKREHVKSLDEGYYGTRQTSYSDSTPSSIKMIIKHTKPLEETDARYRNIQKIFLETEVGERILVPSTRPGIGRVFARHLAEGGQHNDDRWNHIVEMTGDVSKLGGFVRATRNKQFNESAVSVITEATQKYQQLKETLKRLQSHRGYTNYFESWQPTLMEETNGETLTELFKNATIDARIESAIPTLSKMGIYIAEAPDIDIFEQWADGIIDEALVTAQPDQVDYLVDLLGPDSDYMALGPDAMNAMGEIMDVLPSDSLFQKLRHSAEIDANRDARPIIIAWMSEQPGAIYDTVLDEIQNDTDEEQVDVNVKVDDKKTVSESFVKKSIKPAIDNSSLSRIKRLSGL